LILGKLERTAISDDDRPLLGDELEKALCAAAAT
jgi:hypothetical protein